MYNCKKKHEQSAEELMSSRKYTDIGMAPHDIKIFELQRICGFEKYSAYEGPGTGWDVALYVLRRDWNNWHGGQYFILDKPLVAANRCLTCAVENVIKQAEVLEECQES